MLHWTGINRVTIEIIHFTLTVAGHHDRVLVVGNDGAQSIRWGVIDGDTVLYRADDPDEYRSPSGDLCLQVLPAERAMGVRGHSMLAQEGRHWFSVHPVWIRGDLPPGAIDIPDKPFVRII